MLYMEGVELSDSPVELDETLGEILKSYFLMAFKDEERYRFSHPTDNDLNAVYSYASQAFENDGTFHEQSKNMAKYLYEQSEHPNIKRGDLYVVYFKDCISQRIKIPIFVLTMLLVALALKAKRA